MASPQPVPSSKTSDRDLASMAEARSLARRAKLAQAQIAELSQEKIDAIVDAMAAAVASQCESLARLAVEETGYGVVADKVQKNQFSADRIYKFIRPMRTVGVLQRLEDRKVIEIAEPFGVVAAVVPSTNPTSTAIYKILMSLKARCAIVISPHPSAVRCITRVAEIMNEAARGAGAPDGSINWMTTVTLEGTQELMKSRDVAVILATGGMGLVRAAYSSASPPTVLVLATRRVTSKSSADITKAASASSSGRRSTTGSCVLPNSVVVDASIGGAEARARSAGRLFSEPGRDRRADPGAGVTPAAPESRAGRQAGDAHRAEGGHQGTTRHPGADRSACGCRADYPLSIEARPVLSFTVVQDWKAGCESAANSADRWHGAHHVDSFQERSDHSGVRSQSPRFALWSTRRQPTGRSA